MLESQNSEISFRITLSGYFSLALLGALGGLIRLLLIPSDPKNSFLLGYSSTRLVFILFFLIAIISTAYFALKTWRNPQWTQKIETLFFGRQTTTNRGLGISSTVFIFSVFLFLLSFYQFKPVVASAERIRPFIGYLALVSFQTTLLILHRGHRFHWKSLVREIQAHRLTAWIGGGCLAIFAGLWMVILLTGVGIQPTAKTNWYETGVPILGIQVLMAGLSAAAAAGLIAWLSQKVPGLQEKHSKWIDILLALGIWGLAAFLWSQAPMPPNFFAPGPFPPGSAYLPYSDAATFDLYAQYALVGQGIANGRTFIGHFAYIGFLACLHLLAGQDYNLLVSLQVVLFASLPVIVYFIGKLLSSRFLGVFLAGLIIMQELNAIASGNRLNLSHSRLLLTEFPTKICLAALILLLFIWLRKKPGSNFAYALPLGGILGVVIMLRYNTIVMLFGIIAGMILVFGKEWRKWLTASALLMIVLGITISPWMWRSWKLSGNPFFFAPKVSYRLNTEFQAASETSLTTAPIPTAGTESAPLLHTADSAGDPPPQIDETESNPPLQGDQQTGPSSHQDGIVYLIGNHFVHNLVTSLLILPTRPTFDFLPASIANGSIYESLPYWKNPETGWLEALAFIDIIGVGFNLLLLSIGIGDSFRKWSWAGWIPLGVLLAYHLSTAVLSDSGGRYIVPVNWIVFIYFGIGLLHIARYGSALLGFTLRDTLPSSEKPLSIHTGILLTLPFILYVVSLTVLDQALPHRYYQLSNTEVLERLTQEDLLERTNIDSGGLEIFLDHPDARAVYGMNLYPRFYYSDQGLHSGIDSYRPYPRLAFTIITALGTEKSILPLTHPPQIFPHGSDVIVIGCQSIDHGGQSYIDALLIASLGDQPAVYTRAPAAPLSCPLPQP